MERDEGTLQGSLFRQGQHPVLSHLPVLRANSAQQGSQIPWRTALPNAQNSPCATEPFPPQAVEDRRSFPGSAIQVMLLQKSPT